APYLVAQNTVTSPHGDNLKIACEVCHTTLDWNDVPLFKFNHEQVGYPLSGEHKFAECSACHNSFIFSQVGTSCADCHTDIHKGELGNQCESCHNSKNWENRQQVIEQHNQTNFPLIGVHSNLDCESCHINEQQRQFVNLPVECQSCHLEEYMNTLSPSHQKVGFDLDCQKCHLPTNPDWDKIIFEHPAAFPLM
ncbi:MAG: cytochrome c3 family protein, partial [Gammaproteobacteria bacterium]|nr:cytochrome c3 family protein [Gammaproteobacteria bacterium]